MHLSIAGPPVPGGRCPLPHSRRMASESYVGVPSVGLPIQTLVVCQC
jgi:hypothetical protein